MSEGRKSQHKFTRPTPPATTCPAKEPRVLRRPLLPPRLSRRRPLLPVARRRRRPLLHPHPPRPRPAVAARRRRNRRTTCDNYCVLVISRRGLCSSFISFLDAAS
ncbi:hypothetical protein EXIGLDRAFT_133532 [Exidia glandulosa HHB12029]|uniref:Uncharacterized protein n=1 Tax=Exidia glandulosa HHB12029 TaxID=1314781 RepID=A0A165NFC6_EXIGL|nr:hypothetical protein EXIGLDRAFT_133532 [Exidia glandulosa HHB12029]